MILEEYFEFKFTIEVTYYDGKDLSFVAYKKTPTGKIDVTHLLNDRIDEVEELVQDELYSVNMNHEDMEAYNE